MSLCVIDVLLIYRALYSTWSTGRNIGDGWPDPSIDNENKDWSVAPTAAAYTDLVQEFEPGKPWKVTVDFISYIQ